MKGQNPNSEVSNVDYNKMLIVDYLYIHARSMMDILLVLL